MLLFPRRLSPARRAFRGSFLTTALVSALALTACVGGGDDSTPTAAGATILDVAAPPLVKSPNQGLAKLGTLVGATVEVMDLHSDTSFYTTTSDAQGKFKLDLGTHPLTELYRVRVSGGTDVDFSDTGVAGQAPVANTAVLTALATGQQIAENGVSVTVLSDLLARRVGDTATWNPTALVMRELNNAARSLVETDINGDGVIDYLDILGFNPGSAVHKDSLAFDYADLFIKNPDGQSVMDLYHANDPALNSELDVVMSDLIDFRLPDADAATLAALNFGVEGHGTLQTSVVTAATIDHDNGRYLQAVDKSTTQFLQVRATPAAGGQLLAWEGCEQDATDPLLCRVTPDTSKSVIAIFKDVDVLAAGTSVIHLPSNGGSIGLVLQQDKAVVTAMATDPVVGQLDAALAKLAADPSWQIYIGGDRAKAASLHVTSLKERTLLDGVVRYAFGYAEAAVTDALTAGSAYAPPAAISVDTISAVRYAQDPTAAATTILPQNEANSDFVAGPNPVDAAIDSQLCGSGRSQHLLVDGNVACIANANLPVQSETGLTHACAATEALVESLDGEEYCVAPADVHPRAAVRALSARVRAQSVVPGRVQAAAATALAVLEQPVQTNASTVSFKPGQVAWLVGQGKAIYLAHNVFMVDRSDGRGITLVTVDGAVESVPVASTRALAYQQCSNDIAAPECRFFGRNQAAYMNKQGEGRVSKLALLPVPIVWEFSPESAPWIKFKLKPQVDLTGTASANFDFGVVYYAFGSRGKIEVTPILNTSISADGLALFEKPTPDSPATERKESGKAKMLKSGEPIFEKQLFGVDFIQKIPGANAVSPVLESNLNLSIGLDAAGNAKIDIVTDYKQVVAWDVRSEFTYRVFGDNHNVQSFKVGSQGFPGATLKGEFNASLGLYAKAEVTMGVRALIPKLTAIEAKYYPMKLEALGKALVSYQTDPVKVAAQNGQNFCWAGAASMTFKESFEVTARYDFKPEDKTLKAMVKYIDLPKKEFPLFNKDKVKWSIGSKIGEFAKKPDAGADTDVTANGEANDNLEADTKLACAKPSPDKMPAERSYAAGHLELDGGGSIFTKTHELTMQPDGNLVIYAWDGNRGAAKWATATNGKGVYNRVKFQADGNLVVVDMLETAHWSSGSHDIGAKTIRFAERGALEVLTADGTLVWSSDGGINAGLPETKDYAPGYLILARGDSILTRSRVLVMQPDGNLVLYRVKDGRTDGAVWASGTNDGTRAVFQADGNLVVYRADGTAAWDAGTYGKGATRLAFQADGNLVIYRNGDALWARGK